MNIKGLVNYTEPVVASATLLGLCILLATGVGVYAAYKIKAAANTIEVTGSAKETVVADYARWTINLDTRTGASNQEAGFERLDIATKRIREYLSGQGLSSVEVSAPTTYADYIYQDKAAPLFNGYVVSQVVIVSSADIDKIETLATDVSPFVGTDYHVTTNSVELTYQKLPEERVKLLAQAIKDAKARAESIAKESDNSVGALKSATGGVVQVLPQGGVEISDYGMYDTQSRQKDIMVTVRANFQLR